MTEKGDDGRPAAAQACAGRMVSDPFKARKRYGIVYADPPWTYRDGAHAGMRGVLYKYGLLADADVAALPVSRIVADDAALFLWATWPKLHEILPIIDAWGFRYRTVAFVWVKRTRVSGALAWGMGSWTRANTEPCLLATRGRPRRVSAGVHQVVEAPLARHSQKPAIVRDRIVELLGELPRIELFARERAAGWDAWGDDASIAAPVPETAAATPTRAQEEQRARVLAHLRSHGRLTNRDVVAICGVEPLQATKLLRRLVREGTLRMHGTRRWAWYERAAGDDD